MITNNTGLIVSFEFKNLDTGSTWKFIGVNSKDEFTEEIQEEINNVHLDEELFELADEMHGWTDEYLHFDELGYEEELDSFDHLNDQLESPVELNAEDVTYLKAVLTISDVDADDEEVDELLRQIVLYFEEEPWSLEISNIDHVEGDDVDTN